MKVVVFGGFRTHILLAHDVVGTIIDNEPTFKGLVREGEFYLRRGRRVMRVTHHGQYPEVHVVVKALEDIWLQEMGLTVKLAGEGEWLAHYRDHTVKGPYDLNNAMDEHHNTVHFSRVRSSPHFCTSVDYRELGTTWRITSPQPGFAALLDNIARVVPWRRCQVFDRNWMLRGVYQPAWSFVRAWELAAGAHLKDVPPGTTQLHLTSWGAGAGAVVNEHGHTPEPGATITSADGFDKLQQPETWRLLKRGHSVHQTVKIKRLP